MNRGGGKMIGRILTSSGESLSISSAIFGTTLPLGDRCLSIVPPGLLDDRTRGFSVATLARRPRIVEGTPAGWLEFATLGDARRRRDEALRCSITVTFCDSCSTRFSSISGRASCQGSFPDFALVRDSTRTRIAKRPSLSDRQTSFGSLQRVITDCTGAASVRMTRQVHSGFCVTSRF